MYRSTLLAPKLLILDRHKLFMAANPDVEWRLNRIINAPCAYHRDPVESCTCGIVSTVDGTVLKQVYRAEPNMWDIDYPITLVGVVQVLGTVIVDYDLRILRSTGAFLWGLVKPKYMKRGEFAKLLGYDIRMEANPVLYESLLPAMLDCYKTMKEYKIFFNKKER